MLKRVLCANHPSVFGVPFISFSFGGRYLSEDNFVYTIEEMNAFDSNSVNEELFVRTYVFIRTPHHLILSACSIMKVYAKMRSVQCILLGKISRKILQ